MQGIRTLPSLAVSAIFASIGPGALAADHAGPGGALTAAPAQQAKSYPGLMPLVSAHRAEQVKMVKLWQKIKSGQRDDKTAEDYKEAQARTAKASAKVSDYIEDDKWSVEDRLAMQKLWAAELEKPIE